MRIWGFGSILWMTGALAAPPANEWSRIQNPTRGNPESIGFYSGGCIRGAQELPQDGNGYQAMYFSRHRRFAHPELLESIETLGRKLDGEGSALLVGDVAQPRGGPMPYGHASHQLGLDADLWFWTHPEQRLRKLTREERDTIRPVSMLDAKGRVDPRRFGKEQVLKLRFAAEDPKVERIFVNPAIKLHLCKILPPDELEWLRKLRPWPGHDEHFHIRIACPAGSPDCRAQDPVPAGDGCADAAAAPAPLPGGHRPRPKLPEECPQVLRE